MQRTKMVWLPLQNFPIAALGVCQISLPMQRQSLIELGFECRHSWLLRAPALRVQLISLVAPTAGRTEDRLD